MNPLLVKIFAIALALSQAMTAPDSLQTKLDRNNDQERVVTLLRQGCAHIREAFKIDDLDLDDLIATALQDPDAVAAGNAAFHGIKFTDLQGAYRALCTNERTPDWNFDASAVIDFYNKTIADLPDPARLKGLKLPGATVLLDRRGGRFREMFEAGQRRISVPLGEIPDQVRKAFVAAEDKRFYEHAGIDEHGLIRAALADLAQAGRPQGASTITQQVVKNLLVGDEVSYERKIREIVLATQLEHLLSKDEILELYLNTIYLGRNSWGVEMAARSYFGKSVRDLTLPEAALLAGLPKGPSYFSPDRYPERMRERQAYVLTRMQENGVISTDEAAQARAASPTLVPPERPQRDFGFYFADQAAREARTLATANGVSADSYTIRTTVDVPLQRSVEEALQEGLWRYERNAGRVRFQGAEANLGAAIERLEGAPKAAETKSAEPKDAGAKGTAGNAAEGKTTDKRPAWQRALAAARLPLYDVHWTHAVVLPAADDKRRRSSALKVGLADGRIVPLSGEIELIKGRIKPYDVLLVHLNETKSGSTPRAELRVRPEVQGAAVVLENATGRILAMTGGFSYPLSQLNRVTQAQRQPGSAIKPLSYLAALENGLEPNTLIRDEPITLPPVGGRRGGDSWSPKNYEGGWSGTMTLRQALENSRNLATAHLLEGGIDAKPEQSLDRLCTLALSLSIYRDCVRYYPFMLGAQPVRPVDLAAFFAAIANEGARPAPHAVEAIEQDGTSYRREAAPAPDVRASDRAAFYQLKTMMQGVVQRGTARALAPLAPYVAGKTGTTEDQNDAWFIGFTNDITVAVWVGYDNAGDVRRTLGEGATGAVVAAPIFESIVETAWSHGMAKSVLAPPSPAARSRLSCPSSDRDTSTSRRPRTAEDCLRLDEKGRTIEARYRLVPRAAAYARRNTDDDDSTRTGGSVRPPANEQGGYSAYGNGNAGHQGDWGRNWFGGWGRGYWNW